MSLFAIGAIFDLVTSRLIQATQAIAVVFLLVCLYVSIRDYKRRKTIAGLISEKRLQRRGNEKSLRTLLQKIIEQKDQEEGGGKTEKRWKEIRELRMDALLKCLRNGDVTPLEALRAYQHGALKANCNLNCVVYFFPCAETRALELEQVKPEDRGPLYGLPVSVKECYEVKGYDTTLGLGQNLFRPSEVDCASIQRLRKLGAVPSCHTNVPQCMMSFQTSNPIYGATGNPVNSKRECGGSSGGEAALIGAGGSILGLGTDTFGSLRCPAALCGIVSLKPSHGRHFSSKIPHPIMTRNVGGFMTRDVGSCVSAWKAAWANTRNIDDTEIAPIPWNETKYGSKNPLRIGYFADDGVMIPHPACKRAVHDAVEILKARGHELFKIDPPPTKELLDVSVILSFCDGGNWYRKALAHNPFDTSAVVSNCGAFVMSLPRFLQHILCFLAKYFLKVSPPVPRCDGEELQAAMTNVAKMARKYHCYLKEQRCDALICLAAYYPAPIKGTQGLIPASLAATTPWSVMDMTAGVVPISRVTREDEEGMKNDWPRFDLFYALLKRRLSGGIGLPVAAQVVACRYEEELVLRVMSELEESRAEMM